MKYLNSTYFSLLFLIAFMNIGNSQSVELLEINPGEASGFNNGNDKGFVLGDYIYFLGDNGTGAGMELMRTDGTVGGTTLIKDINVGPDDTEITYFQAMDDLLLFEANIDGTTSLYRSDGTAEGTFVIYEYVLSNTISGKSAYFNGSLYFVKNDFSLDFQLSKTDGSNSDIIEFDFVTNVGRGMFVYNNLLHFTGIIDDVRGLYSMDENESFTLLKAENNDEGRPIIDPSDAELIDETLFYVMETYPPYEEKTLYTYNLSTGEDQSVIEMGPGNITGNIRNVKRFNDKIVFDATDGENGRELWISDGTNAGTQMLEVYPGSESGLPFNYMGETLGNLFLFEGNFLNMGTELWATDGTPSGTVLVKEIREGNGSSISNTKLKIVGNKMFFEANDGQNGTELYVSDGSTEGTYLYADIVEGSSGSFPKNFLVLDSCLYFSATTDDTGTELYKTCGNFVNDTEVDSPRLTVTIFPNPTTATEGFHLGFPEYINSEEINLSLFNVTGQRVFEKAISIETSVFIEIEKAIPMGMYFLRGTNANGQVLFTKPIQFN